MSLRQLVAALSRWRLLIALLILLGVGTAAGYGLAAPKQYTSETALFFSVNGSTTVGDLAQGSTYTRSIVKSYSQIATLPVVLTPVIRQLGLPDSPTQLARRIEVSSDADTVLVTISVVDPSAAQSARIANAVADQLARIVTSLTPGGAGNSVAVKVTVLSAAVVPTSPSSPNIPLLVGAGIGGSILLALTVTAVLEILVTPVVSRDSAERLAPVLGRMPATKPSDLAPKAIMTKPYAPYVEALRVLRTNVRRLENADGSSTCIVITSALPAEGRTTITTNLAIALARTVSGVLLVEADLRRPILAGVLGLSPSAGLADVLAGQVRLESAVQSVLVSLDGTTLDVLIAGTSALEDPAELLARQSLVDVIDQAKHKYRIILVDTPPLLPVADPALFAGLADGTLVVARARRTTEHQLAEAVRTLSLAGAQVRGVVLNAVPASQSRPGRSRLTWLAR